MASFVIHTIAAECFLKKLEDDYGVKLSKEEKDEFLMANLIPDSSRLGSISKDASALERQQHRMKIQDEKIATHFRNIDDQDLCIQVPDLDKFVEKYGDELADSKSYLGYLFHLYTDKTFFEDLFTKTFDTLDENNEPTIYNSKTCSMLVKKNNKIYTVSEFWDGKSSQSIYHDYTVMNRILLEHFGLEFDGERLKKQAQSFKNPGIEEVDFENITKVLNKTESFIKESYAESDINLNIFDKDQVIDFINENAYGFIEKYKDVLSISGNKVLKK